jgi:hypothetical protein
MIDDRYLQAPRSQPLEGNFLAPPQSRSQPGMQDNERPNVVLLESAPVGKATERTTFYPLEAKTPKNVPLPSPNSRGGFR